MEDEVEGLRRVEKQVAEFAVRRARELAGDESESWGLTARKRWSFL